MMFLASSVKASVINLICSNKYQDRHVYLNTDTNEACEGRVCGKLNINEHYYNWIGEYKDGDRNKASQSWTIDRITGNFELAEDSPIDWKNGVCKIEGKPKF